MLCAASLPTGLQVYLLLQGASQGSPWRFGGGGVRPLAKAAFEKTSLAQPSWGGIGRRYCCTRGAPEGSLIGLYVAQAGIPGGRPEVGMRVETQAPILPVGKQPCGSRKSWTSLAPSWSVSAQIDYISGTCFGRYEEERACSKSWSLWHGSGACDFLEQLLGIGAGVRLLATISVVIISFTTKA